MFAMQPNPYESPQIPDDGRPPMRQRRKHPVGYLAAAFLGATVIAGALMPFLADLDDSR